MQDVIRRTAALSAALLLALTACSDNGDSVAESRPDYANQTGEAGAEKFAGYWVDQINQATETGKTEGLASLGLKGCDACSDFPRQVDTIYEAGGRVESEDWTIKSVVPEAGATDEQVGMLITVEVPPNTVYADKDAKPQEFPGGDQRFRMIVVRQADHWMIKELTPR
jgi:hypothetical protein